MKELFWNLFEKSGNIDAFMAYREYNKKDFKSCGTADLKTGYSREING